MLLVMLLLLLKTLPLKLRVVVCGICVACVERTIVAANADCCCCSCWLW